MVLRKGGKESISYERGPKKLSFSAFTGMLIEVHIFILDHICMKKH